MQEADQAQVNWRNITFAAIFVAFSIATGFHAWRNMTVGTASAMGPGFFPLMLSIVLGALSAAVAFTSDASTSRLRLAPLKSFLLIIGSPIVFALSIRSLGLVIAVAATVFMASFASRHATLRDSLLLAAGFTAFCVAVFHFLLALPIPLWGSLIAG